MKETLKIIYYRMPSFLQMENWGPEILNDFSELVSVRDRAGRLQVLLAPNLLLNTPKPRRREL